MTPDEWIPLFTQHWPDAKILAPDFCMTFDHCKLCDTHVARGEQKEHVRKHKRELKTYRTQQRRKVEIDRVSNLAKARKARAA
jgi:hypothetical protein